MPYYSELLHVSHSSCEAIEILLGEINTPKLFPKIQPQLSAATSGCAYFHKSLHEKAVLLFLIHNPVRDWNFVL